MSYKIVFTKQALKDLEKISQSNYKHKVLHLLEVLENNPFQPPYEKLVDLNNTFSRRINVQHRLVYQVLEADKTIKIIRMWTHYE